MRYWDVCRITPPPHAPLRLEWTTHSYKHCSYAIIRLYTKDDLLDVHSWLLDLELHSDNIEFYLPLCLKSRVPVKSDFDEHTAQYLHDIVTLRRLCQPTWVRQLCGQHPFCDAPFPDYNLHNDRFGREDLTDAETRFEWRESVVEDADVTTGTSPIGFKHPSNRDASEYKDDNPYPTPDAVKWVYMANVTEEIIMKKKWWHDIEVRCCITDDPLWKQIQ